MTTVRVKFLMTSNFTLTKQTLHFVVFLLYYNHHCCHQTDTKYRIAKNVFVVFLTVKHNCKVWLIRVIISEDCVLFLTRLYPEFLNKIRTLLIFINLLTS